MTNDDISEFIKQNFNSDVFDLYSSIQIGASQADFWRILILQKRGGVYIDIDSHLVWPLELIIMPEYAELYLSLRNLEITNYFLASKKNNPNLAKIIEKICQNIRDNKIKSIYKLTGPAVINDLLINENVEIANYRITCQTGNFTNKYFQYMDKKEGIWTIAQKEIDIIRKKIN